MIVLFCQTEMKVRIDCLCIKSKVELFGRKVDLHLNGFWCYFASCIVFYYYCIRGMKMTSNWLNHKISLDISAEVVNHESLQYIGCHSQTTNDRIDFVPAKKKVSKYGWKIYLTKSSTIWPKLWHFLVKVFGKNSPKF